MPRTKPYTTEAIAPPPPGGTVGGLLRSDLTLGLLTTIHWPAILLGDALRLLAWNPAAEHLLTLDTPLRLEQGGLTGRHARTDAALRQAWHALGTDADSASAPHGTSPPLMVRVPLAGQVVPLLLWFLALRSKDPPSEQAHSKVGLLLIQHPVYRPRIDPAILQSAFEQTLAEARIAAGLAQAQDPADIAREQRVAISTVRKHATAIYRKLGVSRVQDLMVLIHSSPWTVFRPTHCALPSVPPSQG